MARCYDLDCELLAWTAPPPDVPPPDDEAAMASAFGEAGWTAGEIEEREAEMTRRRVG